MSRHIIAIVDDLFSAAKIGGTAEQAGVKATFPRTSAAALEAALNESPSLILCDLHVKKIDALEFARRLKADERTRDIPPVGFFAHVQTELQQGAIAAGFDC